MFRKAESFISTCCILAEKKARFIELQCQITDLRGRARSAEMRLDDCINAHNELLEEIKGLEESEREKLEQWTGIDFSEKLEK